MNLLNGALAFGALAFSVPLLIHLLTKSRFQVVDWGAMHLLDEAVQINSRRMKLEQFLLLLLRCLIPIILALCLARPVLTGAKALIGETPQSLVLLIDDSYSMNAAMGGSTRLDKAKVAGEKIVRSLASGSEVAVMTTGGSPTWLTDKPMFDPLRMAQNLASLQGGSGASRMELSLDQAFTALAGMSHVNRRLVLLSDFQVNDWKSMGDATYSRFSEQINSLPIKPSLAMLSFNEQQSTQAATNETGSETPLDVPNQPASDNQSIESLEASRRLLSVGQPLEIRVNLRNFSDAPADGLSLIASIDGIAQPPRRLSIAAKSGAQITVSCSFEESGSHIAEIKLESRDQIQSDNVRSLAVSVMKQVAVVLIDGDRRGEPLKSDTDFIAIALAPYAFGGITQPDAFSTTTFIPGELNDQRLKDKQAVVLANVDRLSDDQVKLLETFVHDGGCLFVFLGSRVQADWYNQKLFAAGNGLLPYQLATSVGDASKPESATHIAVERFAHDALEIFNRGASELAAADIRQWYQLKPPDESALPISEGKIADKRSANVLLRLESGDPLLVESKYADGNVLLFATSCDVDWTDLPTKPVYLPLVQQLLSSAVAPVGAKHNLETGEAIVQTIESTEMTSSFELLTPLGSRRTLKPTPESQQPSRIEYPNTQRPGIYSVTADKQPISYYAVNSQAYESEPATIDPGRLMQIAKQLSATIYPNVDTYLAEQHKLQFGSEIWRWVLFGLLGLMFGELILQQWFTRGER